MTREEALTVINAFFENPLISEKHKAAFNIAMHDIKACHNWTRSNLMLIAKEDFLKLYEGFTSCSDLLDLQNNDLKYTAKTHLNSIYGTMVTDSIYCDTDSIKRAEKTND